MLQVVECKHRVVRACAPTWAGCSTFTPWLSSATALEVSIRAASRDQGLRTLRKPRYSERVGDRVDVQADRVDLQDDRFYVRDDLLDGLALIDRERDTLVVTSYGDRAQPAREALQTAADCLNAATDPDWGRRERAPGRARTDMFKAVTNIVGGALAWRVIEYLSGLYLDARDECGRPVPS